MKALVVDDQPMLLKLMNSQLKRAGFHTISTEDGEEALKFFQEEQPDIVITNLLIPNLSGFELIERIKAIDNRNVPVIVVSGIQMEKTILYVFKLGANDYICKPFLPFELIAKVKKYFFATPDGLTEKRA